MVSYTLKTPLLCNHQQALLICTCLKKSVAIAGAFMRPVIIVRVINNVVTCVLCKLGLVQELAELVVSRINEFHGLEICFVLGPIPY